MATDCGLAAAVGATLGSAVGVHHTSLQCMVQWQHQHTQQVIYIMQ